MRLEVVGSVTDADGVALWPVHDAVFGDHDSSLRALLDGVGHDRLLLMTTADATDPARRLYAAEGWAVLGPGIGEATVIMGKRGHTS